MKAIRTLAGLKSRFCLIASLTLLVFRAGDSPAANVTGKTPLFLAEGNRAACTIIYSREEKLDARTAAKLAAFLKEQVGSEPVVLSDDRFSETGATNTLVVIDGTKDHRLITRYPESKSQGHRDKVNGKLSTSLEDYEKNLEALVLQLKDTGAVLIWASTTLVPEREAGRFVGDDAKYNAVAERVMEKHGVLINDLYATTKAFPPGMFKAPGDVHYTPEGSAKLADQVAAKVSDALKIAAKNKPR